MPFYLQILINLAFSYLASVSFALTINVPHRVLHLAGISGVCGWMTYWLAARMGLGRMLSNLLGAFLIGILSLLFARLKKCPVTVFDIPALVPLVPGVPAYQAIRALVNGQFAAGEAALLRVAIVTCAIALGILLSTMVSEIFYRGQRFYRKRHQRL